MQSAETNHVTEPGNPIHLVAFYEIDEDSLTFML